MRKRINGDGSVFKVKSGCWRGQLMDGYTEAGKKKIVSFSAPTKSEVQQKIRNYLTGKQIEVSLPKATQSTKAEPEKKKMPFSKWADTWYADYKSQIQPSTYANYRFTLNSLKEHFGDRPIDEIMLLDINAYMNSLMEKGYSNSSITKCKSMLIQIFSFAEDNDLIVKNPALKAKIMRDLNFDEGEGEKDAFTEEEIDALMKYLPDTLLGNSIRVLLKTGMRVQELLALTPSDVSEDCGTITISKAIKTVAGKSTLGTTKSKKSKRTIPVPEDAKPYVQKMKAQGGRVFLWMSKRTDFLYSTKWFRLQYYKAIKAVPSVRPLSPHCCRHTYITRLEAAGVPLQLIARLVGHSRCDTTIGYTHTDIDTLRNAVNKAG